eukprot:Awhi_evm1s5960
MISKNEYSKDFFFNIFLSLSLLITLLPKSQALNVDDNLITDFEVTKIDRAPDGSYRKSCNNIKYNTQTGVLKADCLTNEIIRRCDNFCCSSCQGCAFFQCRSPEDCRAQCLESNFRPTSSLNLLLRRCSNISNSDGRLVCDNESTPQITIEFYGDNNLVGKIVIDQYSYDLAPIPEMIANINGVNR